MPIQFDHERLKAYQKALEFVSFAGPIIDELPAKLAARDQLDRASTSVVLNLAEGNGKRSHPDRCRYFDIARGSGVECAACLDVLVARGKMTLERADQGKAILVETVSMTAGLIARFSGEMAVREEQAPYGDEVVGGEKE
ncbi:MAG: four helix bundle protein [Verrucomicrobia bacterium]|nr:four helix bundle protein [Verrucomicrobiota bacterium]